MCLATLSSASCAAHSQRALSKRIDAAIPEGANHRPAAKDNEDDGFLTAEAFEKIPEGTGIW